MGGALAFERPALEFDSKLEVCPLCAAPEIGELFTDGAGVRIASCRACDLRFMNPQYTDAALAAFYANYRIDATLALGEFDPGRRARKLRNMQLAARHIAGGRFLGVGCGDGLELVLARELGFEVAGLEVDDVRARRLAEHFGCEVLAGELPEAELAQEAYSLVYMDQVLEHPKRPGDYLRKAFQLLRPGGVLYVGVPNIRSVSSEWKSLRDRTGLRSARKRGSHYDTWQHLSYFGPRQLAQALSQHFDFEVLEVVGDPECGGSRALERLRTRFPRLDSSLLVIARRPR